MPINIEEPPHFSMTTQTPKSFTRYTVEDWPLGPQGGSDPGGEVTRFENLADARMFCLGLVSDYLHSHVQLIGDGMPVDQIPFGSSIYTGAAFRLGTLALGSADRTLWALDTGQELVVLRREGPTNA